MSPNDLEARALRLDPKARARLAKKLLASLEKLSKEQNEQLWADEAERRDSELARQPGLARPAREVLRRARTRRK